MQPIFGYISDRVGPRWVVAGGVVWMGAAYTLGILIPDRAALVFLVMASLGSGAFHPAGTMQATARGRTHFTDQETTATSYFFIFGQAGLFIGPLAAGYLLDGFGMRGLLALPALAVPIGLLAAWQLRGVRRPQPIKPTIRPEIGSVLPVSLAMVGMLAIVAASRSWVQQSAVTFLPKYLNDLGMAASQYGSLSGLFMGGSALGLLAGGNLADRFGKRLVAASTLAMAAVPLFLISLTGDSGWLYLLIPLAGALTGASHGIMVVFAQRVLPGRMGLASGLILGFMFSSGSIGALISGYLADLWGTALVFPVAAGMALFSAFFALKLPRA
jgi:FSR family fosmidomycin resistance protein-like MFS transporter